MDRSTSDSAQSADSGIVLSDSPDQSTDLQSHNDLSRLFRLEDRSIVCASAHLVRYEKLLTLFSDWRTWRTRHGSGSNTPAIRCRRDRHRHGDTTATATMEYVVFRGDERENKLLTLGQMVSSSLQALPEECSSTYLAMSLLQRVLLQRWSKPLILHQTQSAALSPALEFLDESTLPHTRMKPSSVSLTST